MMKASEHNLETLTIVAKQLGSLLHEVVFCGGCVTGLLITDSAMPDVRHTTDVDMIISILTRTEYYELEQQLRKLGFSRPLGDKNVPICRWKIGGIDVDIMPTDEKILGFSNRWYKGAIETAKNIRLTDKLTIKMVTAPYFLATKLEAFYGRGNGDYLKSHNLEDILTIIDGRTELLDEVKSVNFELRKYLRNIFSGLVNDDDFIDALPGHLLPDESSQARLSIIQNRIEQLATIT